MGLTTYYVTSAGNTVLPGWPSPGVLAALATLFGRYCIKIVSIINPYIGTIFLSKGSHEISLISYLNYQNT